MNQYPTHYKKSNEQDRYAPRSFNECGYMAVPAFPPRAFLVASYRAIYTALAHYHAGYARTLTPLAIRQCHEIR